MNMLKFIFSITPLLPTVTGQTIMVVIWGEPTVYTTSQLYPDTSWDDCVEFCYNEETCVAAHSKVSPLNCEIFEPRELWEVENGNSSVGHLLALKVNNSDGTCPNSPTLINNTMFGSASGNNYNVYFDGFTWSISYQNVLQCQAGWTKFSRTLTDWCIKIFAGIDQSYTQEQGAELCAQNDAVLSGLESEEERWFATTLWISGKRKPECYGNDRSSYPYCSDKIKQFDFSDQYMTNYGGIFWDPNQPDGNETGSWQNCVMIWLRQPWQYNSTYWIDYPNGAADDADCTVPSYPDTYTLRGVVCGKLPDV